MSICGNNLKSKVGLHSALSPLMRMLLNSDVGLVALSKKYRGNRGSLVWKYNIITLHKTKVFKIVELEERHIERVR